MELLLSRKSFNKLTAPAPTSEQMDVLFQSALRAPDHASLKPWRYRVYEGKSLEELGELFLRASLISEPKLSEFQCQKIKQKPLRAPMVVVASVLIKEHPKVPEIEQILSGGASVQNLLMAAHFSEIGAMWRTGGLAYNLHLAGLLGMEENEKITGFIYLGQEEGVKRPVKYLNKDEFVTRI